MTLVDQLLSAQADLTAVERFSRSHDSFPSPETRNRKYESLIPLSKPQNGEQYAFAVDLDRCTGCKACVAACHSLNGLEEEETWREVGTLLGGTANAPRQQTVTSACHHCAEPGCLEGCPVMAYEKDEATGIVRHLDDQCIGCQYCILKCPYEVPKYSKNLGIVRKCDMCQSRLGVGEAPACVQACPTQAISIRIISRQEIRSRASNHLFLPDSPDPQLTKPATIYSSSKPLSERAISADHFALVVQPAHTPLAVMLVLTQAGVGLLLASVCFGINPTNLFLGALCINVGLIASVLHLGQPLKAWRAFLGWRTSWLSREIVVLGALGGVSVAVAAGHFVPAFVPFASATLALAVGTGLLGVVCSAWVYHDTGRKVWRGFLSFGRFALTTLLFAAWAAPQIQLFIGVLSAKLIFESILVMRGGLAPWRLDDLDRSARLLRGPLLSWFLIRVTFAAAAIASISYFPALAFIFALAGELCERSLFFKAGVASKMPGIPR